ncbi:MAG TPA: glycosyltransferase family 4 protein, partial [Aggregatilineales bacterium]|nr:glycosyltransferase family 4 protein [Aggregatilineales bacterium]
ATDRPSFQELRAGIMTCHLHAGYPLRLQPWLALNNPQTIGPLRRLLAALRPDVVNGHNVHHLLSYASFRVAHDLGIPAVFTSHDVMPFAYNKLDHFIDPARGGVISPEQYRLPPLFNLRQMRLRYNPLRNLIIRRTLRRDTRLRTCVSEAHRQALEANGLPPFRVVYNGLDPATFDVASARVEALRERLDLVGRRVILLAGRLTREKGGAQLLAAMHRLIADFPDIVLLALSPTPPDFPGYDDLKRDHVRGGGWLEGEDLAAAYHAADIVTMPSIILDCFGMINLEGMAAGKPLISTCFGGSPEIVVDGVTGYIVNPFDTAIFADRLACLLRDPDQRRRMGQAGRKRLGEHFTLTAQVAAMLEVYREALE